MAICAAGFLFPFMSVLSLREPQNVYIIFKLREVHLGKSLSYYYICIFYLFQTRVRDAIFKLYRESNSCCFNCNNPQVTSARQNWWCELQACIIHFASENLLRCYCSDLSPDRNSKGTQRYISD